MERAQSRVDRSKEEKQDKKVKIVMSKGTAKFIKYAWFPVAATLLFTIGIQVGLFVITYDKDTGSFTKLFDSGLWSSLWSAIKNF